MLTREEAAVAMGMTQSEVVEVVAGLGDTTIVTTHDGVRTMVTDDGQFLPYSGSPAAPAADTTVVDEDEDPAVPVSAAERLALVTALLGTPPVDPDETPVVPVVPDGSPAADIAVPVVPDETPAAPPVVPVDPDEAGDVPDNVDVTGDGVPDGPASGVLAWVGEDSQRAAAALNAERARSRPRTSLIGVLERLVGE